MNIRKGNHLPDGLVRTLIEPLHHTNDVGVWTPPEGRSPSWGHVTGMNLRATQERLWMPRSASLTSPRASQPATTPCVRSINVFHTVNDWSMGPASNSSIDEILLGCRREQHHRTRTKTAPLTRNRKSPDLGATSNLQASFLHPSINVPTIPCRLARHGPQPPIGEAVRPGNPQPRAIPLKSWGNLSVTAPSLGQ